MSDCEPTPEAAAPVKVPELLQISVPELPRSSIRARRSGLLTGNREITRAVLAGRLAWLFSALVVALLLLVWNGTVTYRDVSPILFQVPTLLGAAVGFFFGQQPKDRK